MKTMFVLFGSMLMSSLAHASFTVCAGPHLYSSEIRIESGIRPPTVNLTIVYDGKLKVKETRNSSQDRSKPTPFTVELTGPATELESTGNHAQGTRVFRQMAVLKRINDTNPGQSKEVASEEVVCQDAWNHLRP